MPDNLRVELERKGNNKTYVQQPPPQPSNNYPPPPMVSSTTGHVVVSNSPPKFQQDFNTYIPPTSSIPISAAPSGSKVASSSSNYSPSIGFSYQPGMSTSTSMPTGNPMMNPMSKPITIPSVTTVPQSVNFSSGGAPQSVNLSNTPMDNGNYGNRFSLEKIDEQLQQSRKMFPS